MSASTDSVESTIANYRNPACTAGDTLGAQITELCGYIYAANYRLLVMIREFDEGGYAQWLGLYSTAHWLNFKCGIGMNAAREKVRVALALKDLPGISKAFEKGALSYSKVRAMTRIANAGNEDYLLMIAHHGTAYHVEKLVSKYRRAKRMQETNLANEQHASRELRYHYDDDGSLVFHGRLPAEQGALVLKALELAMERQFQAADDGPEGDTPEPALQKPNMESARRADGLAEVAESYLNAKAPQGSSADRYQVVVHVHAEDESADLEDGPHVSAETSRRIGCDCSRIEVTEDSSGEPLSVGRKTRSIPPAIRRALRFRDKGCRFPGCTNTRFVDGHHIQHWADGGETSLDNLVQLCRHHHRLVHEGGLGCERDVDGNLVFRSPVVGELQDQAPLKPLDTTGDPREWSPFTNPNIEIDPDTCISEWRAGENIDWHLAVGHLYQLPFESAVKSQP